MFLAHRRLIVHERPRGYSFVELLVVTTIILILASAVMPLARVSTIRHREAELQRALREIRTAIDKYKDAVDQGRIGGADVKSGTDGYPPSLETLVEGVAPLNEAKGAKLRFLRRIPKDPTTGVAEWGLRAYKDEPDAKTWGGGSVFDVYSLSDGTALDGTNYSDWD
jgi:general secretion pathway protein G